MLRRLTSLTRGPLVERVALTATRRYVATQSGCMLRRVAVGTAAAASSALMVSWQGASSDDLEARCESAEPAYLTANFIADAAAKATPSLVNIRVQGSGFHMMEMASGSGFVIDESGLVLTNTHVVRAALPEGMSARTAYSKRYGGGTVSVTMSDGEVLQGVVQHADPVSDIAIVKVPATRPLPAVKLGSSATLRVGEFVVALGAPAGLTNSVSAGIVSSIERTRSDLGLDRRNNSRASSMHYIQTDAAINSGNSGGPLLNLAGEVIGVNTMKLQGMDGIAFAVPIDEVKRVVSQLTRHGRVIRPYLGLKFAELDVATARMLEQHSEASTGVRSARLPTQGLFVMHVSPDSPAQQAGVRVGDTIVGLGGRGVRTSKELIDGLTEKVGQQVQLDLQRADRRVSANCYVDSMQQ